ncbi:jg4979 [Pararge aegeria aegeria]|uniref:Jg4979 protein n=1 Tax=Pararge aegeria aegeria TaxID=348720 RepID=A0A8S4R1B6_9NEOP|nr:jg4979 [Pararge aegeria aegeria]
MHYEELGATYLGIFFFVVSEKVHYLLERIMESMVFYPRHPCHQYVGLLPLEGGDDLVPARLVHVSVQQLSIVLLNPQTAALMNLVITNPLCRG